MSIATGRLIKPAVIGVATAATLTQFFPGVAAAAATHHASQPRATGETNPGNDASVTPAVTPAGCPASSSPDYGCGKLTVEAVPDADSFPSNSTPDLSGLTFDITGPAAFDNTVTPDASTTCITAPKEFSAGASCPQSEGVFDPSVPSDSTWVAGGQYTIALDTTSGSKPAPPNSLIPPATGKFADCTAYEVGTASGTCPDTGLVKVYGTYHRIGVKVTNAHTHKGVAGATYALCAATASAPTTGTTTCPTGSKVLATATTGSNGVLVFPSAYLGSDNYSVVPTHEPAGYAAGRSQRVEVPVVTTPAQAGTVIQSTAQLTPIKTTVKTRHITTTEDKAVRFNPFAGAQHVAAPLKVLKVHKAHHGKVRHTSTRITYKPSSTYVGKDVFTFTFRNGVGLVSTGKVVVRVKR